jgi:hypothetical protein
VRQVQLPCRGEFHRLKGRIFVKEVDNRLGRSEVKISTFHRVRKICKRSTFVCNVAG